MQKVSSLNGLVSVPDPHPTFHCLAGRVWYIVSQVIWVERIVEEVGCLGTLGVRTATRVKVPGN